MATPGFDPKPFDVIEEIRHVIRINRSIYP